MLFRIVLIFVVVIFSLVSFSVINETKCEILNHIVILSFLPFSFLLSWTHVALKRWQRSSFNHITTSSLFQPKSFLTKHERFNPAGITHVCSLNIICCDHVCLLTSHMKHRVFFWEPTAAHWLEKSLVIGLVEKLHSADNPTEIAHGFPVPKVENKHTPVEYLMKGPENFPNMSAPSSKLHLHFRK